MQFKRKHIGRRPLPRLTIGIDCGSLSAQDPRHYGGISYLTKNLLNNLAVLDKHNYYRLYSFRPINRQLLNKLAPQMKNIVWWPKVGYFTWGLPLLLKLFRSNVFLGLSQGIPQTNIPSIGLIYDLAFLEYPEMYDNLNKLKQNTDNLVKKSNHIITISQSSQSQIIKHFQVPEGKITVCYPGVADYFKPDGAKFIDTVPYFLYVGALKKIKNIPQLINGFAKFLKLICQPFHLVLIGSNTELDPQIQITIKKTHLESSVRLIGYVSEFDLPKYYRGAVGFISLAYMEGFGLPILEAMACGTPVIAADNTAIPEVINKSGLLVNTKNIDQIAQALFTLAVDNQLRYRLSRLALKQAKKFSWRKFSQQVLKCIYQI